MPSPSAALDEKDRQAMNARIKPEDFTDFRVADLGLAAWGRK
jgi:hypothetical protein